MVREEGPALKQDARAPAPARAQRRGAVAMLAFLSEMLLDFRMGREGGRGAGGR